MFEFKSKSTFKTGANDCFAVDNPIKCEDFQHLIGCDVVIDGSLKRVIGVEAFAHTPPFMAGEKIGLSVQLDDTDISEASYERGSKMAYRSMLSECCRQLGYDDPAAIKASWIAEREDIKSALREICEEYGDNDWPDNLHLADVIEKHLRRNLDRNHQKEG